MSVWAVVRAESWAAFRSAGSNNRLATYELRDRHRTGGSVVLTFLRERAHRFRMAERDSRRIAHDILDEPHVAGRRVSVRQVYTLVEKRDVDPESVADRYDLDVADVYHALAYYHDHPREMSEVEADRAEAFEEFSEAVVRPEGVEPDAD